MIPGQHCLLRRTRGAVVAAFRLLSNQALRSPAFHCVSFPWLSLGFSLSPTFLCFCEIEFSGSRHCSVSSSEPLGRKHGKPGWIFDDRGHPGTMTSSYLKSFAMKALRWASLLHWKITTTRICRYASPLYKVSYATLHDVRLFCA